MNRSFAFSKTRVLILSSALVLVGVAWPKASSAKTLIDYFQPTPLACPLSSDTWGASTSIPRDTCNGLEDTKKPPQWIYWDGKIIKAADGKYHMLASRWAGSAGHGGWFGSQAVHAVSESSPLGPFKDTGLAYTNGPDADRSKGHNVSACQLLDGTYCLYVSETVPFTIFTSDRLEGPWTNKGHATFDNNGIDIRFSGDNHIESNVSLVVRPDGNFEVIQRHGVIALSTTGLLGPYKVQRPTSKYPADQKAPANLPTIFPMRKKHTTDDPYAPGNVEDTATFAEDPLIWYSGGLYHVVYDYPDDRVGYHLSSPDGINDWSDRGFAYDARMTKQLFSNVGGTMVTWNKMERPNVIMENGHITHFTFAVTDVDKGQVTGGSNHGNKVIVMAFDGVAFDNEMGVSTDGGVPSPDAGKGADGSTDGGAQGGAGGSDAKGTDTVATGGSGGSAPKGGTTGAGGNGGTTSQGGASAGATGGRSNTGTTLAGGSSGSAGRSASSSGSGTASGGSTSSSTSPGSSGGRSASSSGSQAEGKGGGCGCRLADAQRAGGASGYFVMAALLGLVRLMRSRKRQ